MLRQLSWLSSRRHHVCLTRNISTQLESTSRDTSFGEKQGQSSSKRHIEARVIDLDSQSFDDVHDNQDKQGAAGEEGNTIFDQSVWYSGMSESARRNPYSDATHNYSRHPIAVPKSMLKGIDGVLKSRNLAMLSQHWRDMALSVEARNQALFKAERLRTKVAEARSVGALQDIPASAVTTDSPPLLYGPKEALAHVLHAMLPSHGLAVSRGGVSAV
jgi:hypothetical protein